MDGSCNGNAGQDESQAKWHKWFDSLSSDEKLKYNTGRKLDKDALSDMSNSLVEDINAQIFKDFKCKQNLKCVIQSDLVMRDLK